MKKYLGNNLWTVCFTICLTGFTLYLLLDTFVIAVPYQTDAAEINTSLFASDESTTTYTQITPTPTEKPYTAAEAADNSGSEKRSVRHAPGTSFFRHRPGSNTTSDVSSVPDPTSPSQADLNGFSDDNRVYQDDHIQITISEYEVSDSAVYVADIRLSSAEYLKTAFAYDIYGKNITAKTSDIASSNNAILAINGDYYGAQEKGYVIRNGIVYRDIPGNSDVLCISPDGSLTIVDPSSVSARELADQGVWQAFSFGPALVSDGMITVSENSEVGRARVGNPRTAIGILSDLHYVFVVSDGRTNESDGLTLYELAVFMQQLGVSTAYNLDGGGSSTMVFNGEVINNPTTNGFSINERKVSDIIYIGEIFILDPEKRDHTLAMRNFLLIFRRDL